jgi:hypothetical protein
VVVVVEGGSVDVVVVVDVVVGGDVVVVPPDPPVPPAFTLVGAMVGCSGLIDHQRPKVFVTLPDTWPGFLSPAKR